MNHQSDHHGVNGLLYLDQRAVRPLDDDSQAGVIILADDHSLLASVEDLVSGLGWTQECLLVSELTPSQSFRCDLVIIVTDGRSSAIVPLCMQAARDGDQRVLVVSRDRNPQTVADALNSGADDYIAFPFDVEECRARMVALVTRSGIPANSASRLLWTEPLSRTIGVGTAHASFSAREWELVKALIEADERLVTVSEIERRLWGSPGHEPALASIVSRARYRIRACGLDAIEITTIRGKGYALRYRQLDESLMTVAEDMSERV